MTRLYQIQEDVRRRGEDIASTHGSWPCRKGCDDCCRRLASVPRVTQEEWLLLAATLNTLPADTAEQAKRRIRASTGLTRPVICPLLDADSGACLVYEARPLACRAYGFYAEGVAVLGCSRIESVSLQFPNVIWGNHLALESRVDRLGPAEELSVWLETVEHRG